MSYLTTQGNTPFKVGKFLNEKIKEVRETLDKDTFGAATLRVILRVLLIYILVWFIQRMAGSP